MTLCAQGVTEYMGPKSAVLREVTVPVLSNEQCNGPELYDGIVTPNMVCAAAVGKDSCQGDSGGPLIVSPEESSRYCEDLQVGLVSWGIRCAALSGVEDNISGFPGVYTRVANYYSWIKETLEEWGAEPLKVPRLQVDGCQDTTPELTPSPTPGKACGELHERFEIKQHLCTSSRTPGGTCMKAQQGYNYIVADSVCSGMGARLCTLDELRDGEAKDTGCGFNRQKIWTSTPCGDGFYMVAYGGNGMDQKCMPPDEALDANRCCAEPPQP